MSESQFQSEGIIAASKAARTNTTREVPKELRLSNGVVLRIKPMPPMLLNSVVSSVPEPEVPVVYMEDKEREEPNPNHPAYVQALQDRQIKIALATNNLILAAATELKEKPDNVLGPDDSGWFYLAKMAGFDVDFEDPIQRYLAWLRAVAITTSQDMVDAIRIPILLAGISEEEVAEVVDTFRSGEGGDSVNGVSASQSSSNGNHVQNSNSKPRGRPRRA